MLLTPKMFSSWLRQDVKKILKRKDSDAGERGKFQNFYFQFRFRLL